MMATYFPVKKPIMSRFVYGKYLDEKQNLAKDYNPKTDVIALVFPLKEGGVDIRAIRGERSLRQLAQTTNTPTDHPTVQKWVNISKEIPSMLANDKTDRTPWEILSELL